VVSWAEAYACEAREGDERFDVVIDVRPSSARQSVPYPVPCIECYADELLEPETLEGLAIAYPPGSARICCVCWSGARACRCAFLLRARGWDASWFAISSTARAAREEA